MPEEPSSAHPAAADSVVSAPSAAASVTPGDHQQQLEALVKRGQKVMSSAWMVRTFIKHSDEVEDYPELNELARTIFDIYRAVETQVESPVDYFNVVRKKLGKLRAAAEQFEKDAWHASTHTNFQQAGICGKFVCEQMGELLQEAERLVPRPAPPRITLPVSTPRPPSEST